MSNEYTEKQFKHIVFNQMSSDKYHEQLANGNINNEEFYITNDAFKDHAGGNDVLDIGQSFYIDETQGLRRWLNGSWVDINDNTRPFYERLVRASALNPELLCTNSEYEAILASSAFNQCGKFVIDIENHKIRLPKIVYANGALNISNIGSLGTQRILVARKEPTESSKSWWNWYSDGWLEQGNYFEHASSATGSDQQFDIYLFKPYKDRSYNIFLSSGVGGSGWQYANGAMCGAGGSAMWASWQYSDRFHMCMPNGTSNVYCFWKTEGYANIPSSSDITITHDTLQYYYIQIATGLETVIDIENTVQLNNPYSLGESKYSPILLTNASWLQGGSSGSRTLYPSYYDMLYDVYKGNKTINGITVKAVGDTSISRVDHVINITNETFTLPTLNGSEDTPSEEPSDRLDYSSLVTASGALLTAPYCGWFRAWKAYEENKYIGLYNKNTDRNGIMSPASSGTYVYAEVWANKGDMVEVSTNLTLPISCQFRVATKPGYLYYYVGETVQNANLINAGKLMETNIANTTLGAWDAAANRTYCRKYEDGWCEQGGTYYTGASIASQTITITFPQPFKDTKYVCTFNQVHSSGGHGNSGSENWNNRTTTYTQYYTGSAGFFGFSWRAVGYYK